LRIQPINTESEGKKYRRQQRQPNDVNRPAENSDPSSSCANPRSPTSLWGSIHRVLVTT
jgi:hypothetical protein